MPALSNLAATRAGQSAHGLDAGMDDPGWRAQSGCKGYPADWWTASYDDEATRWALWVCRNECPVAERCSLWAHANAELVDGSVYGGQYWARGHREHNPSRVPRPSPKAPNPIRPRPGCAPSMRTGRMNRRAE